MHGARKDKARRSFCCRLVAGIFPDEKEDPLDDGGEFAVVVYAGTLGLQRDEDSLVLRGVVA